MVAEQAAVIATLAGLDPAQTEVLATLDAKPEGHIALVAGPVEIFLPLAGLVDIKEERARLEKDLVEAEGQVGRLEKLLAGPFAEKAPAQVVQKERAKLAEYKQTAEKIKSQIEEIDLT